MKKIFISLLFLLMITCSVSAKTYTIGKETSTIEVNKGDKIVVELKENLTTGYIWKLNATPETVILEQSKKFINANTEMTGVPGILRYTYKAVAPGKAKVIGIYGRPWEKTSTAATPGYSLDVTVK